MRRVLSQLPLQALTSAHLDELRALAAAYDEVIVVLPDAEEAFTPAAPRSAGQRLSIIMPILRQALPRLPYLLPVKRGGRSAAQHVAQLSALCPAFCAAVCRSEEERAVFSAVLPRVELLSPVRPDLWAYERLVLGHLQRGRVLKGDPVLSAFAAGLAAGPAVRRGLFLTRAQFFHVGHRAFVRQMAADQDEIIVVVATAERSHTLRDPATCGERLELVQPVLCAEVPGRFYLLGAPYEPIVATNLAELQLLCPPFTHVYTSNPVLAALAEEAGRVTVPLRESILASGTELRRRILADEPFDELVPEEARSVLSTSPALRRLRALARGERR